MEEKVVSASFVWLAAFIALLVALGAQTLLENLVPVGAAMVSGDVSERSYLVSAESMWRVESAIRLVSFFVGGAVGVLLVRGRPRMLMVLLFVAAILETVFEQFPGRISVLPLAMWSLAGPAGFIFGALVINAKRRVA